MLYVQLDTNWPDSPKIIEAGMDGRGLHATVLCLAKRLERDGWVPLPLLLREGATLDLIQRLVDLELLERDGNRYRPNDWLLHNPSQAAIAARREAKVVAAKKGNHAKWKHPVDFDNCPICNPQTPRSSHSASESDPVGSQTDRTPTKSKSEGEVSDAIAPSDDHPLARRAALFAVEDEETA